MVLWITDSLWLTDDPFIIYGIIVLWIIAIFVLFLCGIYFLREARQKETFFSLCIAIFFFLFIGASVTRLINQYFIGYPDEPTLQFTGITLILITIYAALALGGLFFIYIAIERDIIKKTHHLLSVMALITLVVSCVNYWLPPEISFPFFTFLVVYPFWIPTLLALPCIYVALAIKSTGIVRKNAIYVLIGMVAFEFGIAFNSPEAFPTFLALGPYLLYWGAPCLQMVGCFLLYQGFRVRD